MTSPRRTLALTMLVCSLGGRASTGHDETNQSARGGNDLTLGQIANIEAVLTLPHGANKLSDYERYYAFDTIDGKAAIVGVFLRSPFRAGARITSRAELPFTADGGCGVLNFRYAVAEKRVTFFRCNGVA